jgi:nicotinamide-nucleotide amidase
MTSVAFVTGRDPELYPLSRAVGERLRERGQTVGVAESCTGGLLGAALTDVPGSSAYFKGGIIAYDNQVKMDQLGVPASVLESTGAVSAGTAEAMAAGVRARLHADIGVSITGVAGPDGEERKPVGLTFIGVAAPDPVVREYRWTSDRWTNRRLSVRAALELLRQVGAPVSAADGRG